MSDEQEIKLRALGRMQTDDTPQALRDLAEELSLPYSRLVRWKKEFKEAELNGTISELVNVEDLTLHRIASDIKHDMRELAPNEGEVVTKEIGKVLDGATGVKLLNAQLQTTALKLAKKVDGLSEGILEPKDISSLVSALTGLQNAFFNKQSTTVNIQNNVGEGSRFSEFKKA